jgi:hypothetical protein
MSMAPKRIKELEKELSESKTNYERCYNILKNEREQHAVYRDRHAKELNAMTLRASHYRKLAIRLAANLDNVKSALDRRTAVGIQLAIQRAEHDREYDALVPRLCDAGTEPLPFECYGEDMTIFMLNQRADEFGLEIVPTAKPKNPEQVQYEVERKKKV